MCSLTLNNRMFNWWRKTRSGCAELCWGSHQVKIHLPWNPGRVRFSVDCCNEQVCGHDTTLVGAYCIHKGFILVADVKADSAVIHWEAEEW